MTKLGQICCGSELWGDTVHRNLPHKRDSQRLRVLDLELSGKVFRPQLAHNRAEIGDFYLFGDACTKRKY